MPIVPIRGLTHGQRSSSQGLSRMRHQWSRGFPVTPVQTTTGGTRRHAGWDRSRNTKRYLEDGFPSHAALEAEIAELTSLGNLFRRGLIRINLYEVGLRPLADALRKWPEKNQSRVLVQAVAAGTKTIARRKKATPDVMSIFNKVVKDRTGALRGSLGPQYNRPRILSGGAAFQKFRARIAAPKGAIEAAGGKVPGENTVESEYGRRTGGSPKRMMTASSRNYWNPSAPVKKAAEKLWITRTLKGRLTKRQGSVGGDKDDTIKPYKYAHLVERGTRFGGWRKTPSKPKPFFRAIYYAKRRQIVHEMVDGLLVGLDKEIKTLFKDAETDQQRILKSVGRKGTGQKK